MTLRMLSITILVLSLLSTGCSLAPEYERPEQRLPDTWGNGEPEDCLEHAVYEACWWKIFRDNRLNQLVERALLHNRDIVQGLARVDAARAALGLARSAQFPQFSAQGEAARSQSSRDTSASYAMAKELGLLEREWERMQNIPAHKSHAVSRTGTVWTGNIQAAWELDFWGKFRNAAEAARESLISAEDTQRALALSVAGQVCSAYFDLLNYDAQWELTQKTLAARREYAELYEKQYAAGAVSTLDILRIRTQVATLTDSLAQAAQQKEQAEAVLLLLVGASPAEILQGKTNRGKLEEISPLAVIPSGLPSALLERRPDILSAEAALKAAHFKVGEARAAFFPSIDLTGSLGMESTALGKLFSGSAGTWTFGGNASLPLLTFGKNLAGLRQAEASVREAVAAYELTVQQAFRDIRESLAVQKAMAEGADSLAEAVRYMEQAADLARLRYAEGYVPYLDVLEAEQTLYSSRMELSSRRAGQLSAVAQVCVALGGGWQSENL